MYRSTPRRRFASLRRIQVRNIWDRSRLALMSGDGRSLRAMASISATRSELDAPLKPTLAVHRVVVAIVRHGRSLRSSSCQTSKPINFNQLSRLGMPPRRNPHSMSAQ